MKDFGSDKFEEIRYLFYTVCSLRIYSLAEKAHRLSAQSYWNINYKIKTV